MVFFLSPPEAICCTYQSFASKDFNNSLPSTFVNAFLSSLIIPNSIIKSIKFPSRGLIQNPHNL
jgi:hypothetical protein